MSPDTDAYWVGALAMTCARAQHLIANGQHILALQELDNVLNQLNHSPVMDEEFLQQLAQYWEPGEVIR